MSMSSNVRVQCSGGDTDRHRSATNTQPAAAAAAASGGLSPRPFDSKTDRERGACVDGVLQRDCIKFCVTELGACWESIATH